MTHSDSYAIRIPFFFLFFFLFLLVCGCMEYWFRICRCLLLLGNGYVTWDTFLPKPDGGSKWDAANSRKKTENISKHWREKWENLLNEERKWKIFPMKRENGKSAKKNYCDRWCDELLLAYLNGWDWLFLVDFSSDYLLLGWHKCMTIMACLWLLWRWLVANRRL